MHHYYKNWQESRLDQAISEFKRVVDHCPSGHPGRSAALSNLAMAKFISCQVREAYLDLDEPISLFREALDLRPHDHPDRPCTLINLSIALLARFRGRGHITLADADDAEELLRGVLAICPADSHAYKAAVLNNLIAALNIRFERQGRVQDLEESIQRGRVLSLSCPNEPVIINNLASALWTRFSQRGDGNDLDEAIQHFRVAQQLTPAGHPHRSALLNNLASALWTRFSQRGDGNDLDEAIQHHRAALQLRPAGHPDRSSLLNNLATALSRRFEQRSDGSDLHEAIQHFRVALQLTPEGHPDRSPSLNNLANALSMRFEQRGDGNDLDEAIQLASTAAEQSLAHPTHLRAHVTLAEIHLARWRSQHTTQDLDDAMDHYRVAAQCAPAGLLQRLQSSLQWVKDAEEHQHTSALDAYTLSLQLLDSHISATTSVSSRHQARKHFPSDLAVDAASCALRQGDVCRAVELLEQGRALHWTQIARFRTSLDNFRSRDPLAEVLVKRFQDLSAMLNRPAQTPFDEGRSVTTIEAEAQRYRDLVEQWNKVVEEIRKFEGFSRFLLTPLFADLREAAREGPIIILISSRFSCDAIIVLHRRSPVHLPLQITPEELHDLVVKHLEIIHDGHGDFDAFEDVMGELWEKVIHPVVHAMKKVAHKGSRIWWCPTSLFTALPLHSAGEYKRGSQVLSKLFVSSYTPSLLPLIKARTYPKTTPDIKFAAIGQAAPSFASCKPLYHVDQEVEEIEKLLPKPPVLFTKLTSSKSTKKQALRTLQDHQWFHLSCHGNQDLEEPFKSHFAMRDGPLSLLDIIDADISGHEFGFLSACETAMGDLSSPDEVIHLAAGLQFMGVK
ncbi:hypothetical protein HYDPIDRAFT_101115, partial [Hydnomerulius pinastri MD-312]